MPAGVAEKPGAKPGHRKPKVSSATLIDGGLVGPKPRPQGVGDGQRVNSPVPPAFVISEGGTQTGWRSVVLELLRLSVRGCRGGKSPGVSPEAGWAVGGQ